MEASAVALRFALFIDLMLLFGLAAFGLHGLRADERRSGVILPFRPCLGVLSLAGGLLSVVALLVMVASMAGTSLSGLDPALVRGLVTDSAIGLAFRVRLVALAVALLAATLPGLALLFRLTATGIAGGVALGSLAWTGHGAMDEGWLGWTHLAADIIHLLAAGVWIGALAALIALVAHDLGDMGKRALAKRALTRFAGVGTAVVTALIVTGLINTWMMLRTGPEVLPLDGYRLLLAAKVVAFAAMMMLAALNRFVLTPHLLEQRGVFGIRISLALEATLGVSILLVVAKLGTMAP